jgi:hypothetical protein
MTESMCDQVTERVALGEPLAELSEHVSSCSSCQGVVAVSSQLGATHHAVDPGLGFSARMTVGAQHRLGVRRRRRLATGLAATVVTGAFGVLIVAHAPAGSPGEPPRTATQRPEPPRLEQPDQPDREPPRASDTDADLAALVQLADVDRSARLSAPWRHIKKPLAPYKRLVKGVVP